MTSSVSLAPRVRARVFESVCGSVGSCVVARACVCVCARAWRLTACERGRGGELGEGVPAGKGDKWRRAGRGEGGEGMGRGWEAIGDRV